MSVGRISGPLLAPNLVRNGINLNIKNTISDTSVFHLDASTLKLGFNTNTTTDEIQVDGFTMVPDVIATTGAEIANLYANGSTIGSLTTPIILQAAEGGRINLSGLASDQIEINDNAIKSYNTNSNIDLLPNGTGTTEIPTNLELFGSLHSQSNITFEGNITIGTDDEDTLVLNAEMTNDLNPGTNNNLKLGKPGKRFGEIHPGIVNGQLINSGDVIAGTASMNLRVGNQFYVAKNGDDSHHGDSRQDPMLTIKAAVAKADASIQGPVEIFVYPGEYEEIFPIEVPQNVTITGMDMRNTVIKPTAGTNTNNCFLLNGDTTISNLTIKDFFSPGHAFSFASNTVVTARSPYLKNITVITAGSVTSASDPRGFDQGDAGKGALIDGANVDSASKEASMLFHSCTFITPGVDAITMTNGVRVEWLNSFTYFANRGLYALNGPTGHLSTDGSTIQYGAELRAIGSANVYGNFGVVADGADTIMYLIQHNFAYIGSGKFKDNDPSRVIQTQEVSKLNSGKVFYSSTDQLGNYRVGDEFFVDLESGETSIVITEAQVNALNGISVTTNNQTSVMTGAELTTNNLSIRNNTLFSNEGSINLVSAANIYRFNTNTNVSGNVSMTGDFTIGGSVIGFGNDANDTINFAQEFDQDIVPDISGAYSLGLASKTWQKAWVSEVQSDDVLIKDNFITTTESNNSLEFRAQGTGHVLLENIAVNENVLGTKTDDLNFTTDTNVEIISTGSIKLPVGTDAERVNSDSTGAPGIGSLRFSSTRNAFEGQTINAPVTFGGVFSANALTSVTADPTSNVLRFIAGGVNNPLDSTNLVAEIGDSGLVATRLQTDALRIDDNIISSYASNSDVQFGMHGTGEFIMPGGILKIKDNVMKITDGGPMIFQTDDAWYKFNGASGIVVPSGGNDTRGPNPQTGDTRFNSRADVKALEVYAGLDNKDGEFQEWIPATGGGESVTLEFMEDQTNIFSLIFG